MLVLHFAAIVITFCVIITFCGDYYILRRNSNNFIRFEENVAKTFHGGLTDLKYEPRVVKHVCHPLNEKDESCLVELYRMYIGLVQSVSSEITAFYFKPNSFWK